MKHDLCYDKIIMKYVHEKIIVFESKYNVLIHI